MRGGRLPRSISMTFKEQEKYVADEIRAGRCPFGMLEDGQTMAHCPLGLPGCSCADEWMLNPNLTVDIGPDDVV